MQSFADDEDRVVPAMTHDEFRRHLFSVTERLSRADVAALSMRFSDGDAVSVPEFLEFVVSPPAVRRARASASAVRVGLSLFELQTDGGGVRRDRPGCARTTRLQAAVRRLAGLWWVASVPPHSSPARLTPAA